MTVAEFAEAISDYCFALKGSITSWGRTPKRNAAVGGVPNSYHLRFLGADVVYDAPITKDHATARARKLGLKVVRESDHDHIQPLISVPRDRDPWKAKPGEVGDTEVEDKPDAI